MKTNINSKWTFVAFLAVFTLLGCQKNSPFTDFKYTDKPDFFVCDGTNYNIYQEALYSFEDDIFKFYSKDKPNTSLTQSYAQFIRNAVYGRIKYEEIISQHSYRIFKALKNESDLWHINPKSYLNYNSRAIACVSKNIQNEDLKTTFDALIATSSMSPKLFGTPLASQYSLALSDKYLALYIALDLFYAKLFDIDLSGVDFNKPEGLDFNVVPPTKNTVNQ